MKELIDKVESLIEEEYFRASDKYGSTNHSDHESYAVILEEFQEADTERFDCESALDRLWEQIKADSSDFDKRCVLRTVRCHALLAACEFIQVAAMADKALKTLECRETKEKLK